MTTYTPVPCVVPSCETALMAQTRHAPNLAGNWACPESKSAGLNPTRTPNPKGQPT